MAFAPENLTVLRKNTCLKHFFSDFFRTKPKIIGVVCCADLTFAGSFWQLILFWFALLKRVKWSFSRYLSLTRMFLVTWEFIFAKLILPQNKTKNTCFFGLFELWENIIILSGKQISNFIRKITISFAQ